MKIQAALARAQGQPFDIVTCDLADPGPDEILVRVIACGICHTDLAVRAQHISAPLPRILGHEGAGIVERIGRDVLSVAPGDHVIMSYGSCGKCPNCASGAAPYCDHSFPINFLGERGGRATHFAGGKPVAAGFFSQSSFATHALSTVRNTVKIDSDLPLQFMAPLGCGFQTGMGAVMLAMRPLRGDSIAVLGCGAVGIAAILAARIIGCSPIIAIDINPARLKLALELGATHAIDANLEDIRSRISDVVPRGTQFAFDTSGVPTIVDQAVQCLSSRGVIVLVAPPKSGQFSFDARSLIGRGRTIRGAVQGDATSSKFIPDMIEFYRRGLLPMEKIVSTFPFQDINAAVSSLEEGTTLKAVLVM